MAKMSSKVSTKYRTLFQHILSVMKDSAIMWNSERMNYFGIEMFFRFSYGRDKIFHTEIPALNTDEKLVNAVNCKVLPDLNRRKQSHRRK